MAKKTIVVDDLDGSENDVVTHRFSVDGEFYEIDLCPQNLAELQEVLKPFVSAGRRVRAGGGGKKAEAARTRPSREERAVIRDWARVNGYEVADRGAFPKDVLEAYQAAQR